VDVLLTSGDEDRKSNAEEEVEANKEDDMSEHDIERTYEE
jgi:hypothetical protein